MSTASRHVRDAPRIARAPVPRTSRLGPGRITLAIGILILGTMIVVSVAAPLITSYKPDAIDPLHPLLHPLSPGHPLGTDSFGRDILSRILYGGRIDLLIAFGATSVTASSAP